MNDPRVSSVSLDELSAKTREQVKIVLDSAFGDGQFFANTQACFFSGHVSPHPNAVLVWSGSTLIGIAIVGSRAIRLGGGVVRAITIGPLAISPDFQRKGFGRSMMSGIEALAKELGAAVGYLQGTPGFYQQFGYFPFLARSKLEISLEPVEPSRGVSSQDFSPDYRGSVEGIYEVESSKFSCAAVRTEDDWNWLTKYAARSYYFYRPQVVRQGTEVIGYFTSDPTEPGRIREAVYRSNPESVAAFVSSLADYASARGALSLEVMTPPGTAIHEHAKANLQATFTQLIQKNRGQLMKIYDYEAVASELMPGYDSASNGLVSYLEGGASEKFGGEQVESHDLSRVPGLLSGYVDPAYFSPAKESDERVYPAFRTYQPQFVFQGDNF